VRRRPDAGRVVDRDYQLEVVVAQAEPGVGERQN
jgi:hypothetical protein